MERDTIVTFDSICVPSEGVVAREIEGEIVIIPLVAGIGDADDELYTLNETGKVIWNNMNGEKTLTQIAEALTAKFSSSNDEIRIDVLGFASEMVKRGLLVVKTDLL